MFPLDASNSEVYILNSFNKVIGVNTLDILGQIETYLEWNGKEIVPKSQYALDNGIDLNNPTQCKV